MTGVASSLRGPIARLKSNKGKPKPYQPTIIKASTARSLAYLEDNGLADFQTCDLIVAPNKKRVTARDKQGREILNDKTGKPLTRMVSHTDPSPTGGI